jgi:hypothetical protein
MASTGMGARYTLQMLVAQILVFDGKPTICRIESCDLEDLVFMCGCGFVRGQQWKSSGKKKDVCLEMVVSGSDRIVFCTVETFVMSSIQIERTLSFGKCRGQCKGNLYRLANELAILSMLYSDSFDLICKLSKSEHGQQLDGCPLQVTQWWQRSNFDVWWEAFFGSSFVGT